MENYKTQLQKGFRYHEQTKNMIIADTCNNHQIVSFSWIPIYQLSHFSLHNVTSIQEIDYGLRLIIISILRNSLLG